MYDCDCDYCVEPPDQACCALCPDAPGYECTRPFGHAGDHIACTIEEHAIAQWPRRHASSPTGGVHAPTR